MGLITLQDVSQSYEDRKLLDGVSLVIGDADRIGLIGPNGSGKSTLLRILAGIEHADEGQRTTRRGLAIGFLEQDPVFDAGLSIRDAIRAGFEGRARILDALDRVHEQLASPSGDGLDELLATQARLEIELEARGGHDVEHRIEATALALGLRDLDADCGRLSGGERRRVALARLLLLPHDVLVLDEPTNHLDAEVTSWLEDRLKALRSALVLVTHDRYFLDRLVSRTIELEAGLLHEYDGGYAEFLEARAARLANDQAAEATRRNLLRREAEWMRRGPPARTTKAKARVDRFHALVDDAPDAADRELMFRIPDGPRLGERVLRFEGVRAGYGDRVLIDGLDLEIGARTRLGIVGPNGAGKSTFLDLCLGKLEPIGGRIVRGSTVRFATIDQRRSDLDGSNTVVEEVSGGNDWISIEDRRIRVESFLEQFLFPGAMRRSKIAALSGGERNRVLLAKLLSAGGNVLVLDEPTNDLDLMTLRVLEEALVEFPGVVLVVSHDRYFLDRVATRILHFGGDGRHRVHEGDLSGLLERLADERSAGAHAATPASSPRPVPAEPTAKPKRLSTREHAELDALPDRITAAETELARFDEELADPAVWQETGERGTALTDQRGRLQAELDALYARWEELETIREAATGS